MAETALSDTDQSVTVVTCYYKVPSKHSHDLYHEWIKMFFKSVSGNLVVYTSQDLVEYLKKMSGHKKNIVIVPKELSQLFICKKYPNIWNHQYDIDPEKHVRTKECYMIWNSKISLLKDAAEANFFNNDKFVWTDIGSFRDSNVLSRVSRYPLYEHISSDKIDIAIVNPFNKKDYFNKRHFFNEIHLSGAVFGGGIKAILKFHDLFYECFDEYIQNDWFIGCDQQLYSTLCMFNPDLFNLVIPKRNGFNPWFCLWYEYSK